MCQPGRPGPIFVSHEASPGLGAFHNAKSRALSFSYVNVDPRAVFHSSKIFLRQFPVCRKFCNSEIVRAVLGSVGEALGFEPSDEISHLRDVIGCANKMWPFDVQLCGILKKCLLVFRRVLADPHSVPCRIANDLVIYIGDVHHITDVVAALPEEPEEHIYRDERPEVPDVSEIVDSGAAGIHPHFARRERTKVFDCSRECVVKAQGHCVGLLSVSEPAILGAGWRQGQMFNSTCSTHRRCR